MALPAGTRLGAYEIVTLIGVGGMGEVYRARDARLNRDVAIKVLPSEVAADVDRLARFEREAQLLASLNHPNIAHINGLEDSTGSPALVMELVEGPTLADRIAKGPIPLDEALPIAKQIAEALEAAHEHGIVHRDLKPANIKVRPDDTVKVLDFGLAKAFEPIAAAGIGATTSPTITTPALTQLGVILGTAAYMSPEQARGKTINRRTDIWAFGCVLFEMLSGTRAFDGEDVAETLGAVIHKDPAWTRLPMETPPSVRMVLQRCLEKDPRQRVHDIGDVRLALSGAFDSPAIPRNLHTPSSRRFVWTALASACVAAAVAGAAAWLLKPPTALPVLRSRFVLPEGLQFQNTSRQWLDVSPDGMRVVYAANGGMYLHSLSELDPRTLIATNLSAGATGAVSSPVFSPDGQAIAYFEGGTLKRQAVSGGSPVTLGQYDPPWGVSWSDAGIVVGQGPKGVVRISDQGGAAEQIVRVVGSEVAGHPWMLPGTSTVLFSLGSNLFTGSELWDKASIVAQRLDTGERKTILSGGSNPRYLRTAHVLVYNVAGTLFAVPFDAAQLRVTGAAVQIEQNVRRALGVVAPVGKSGYAISDAGTLAFIPGSATQTGERRRILSISRRGGVTPLQLPPNVYNTLRVSPDGKRLAFDTDDSHDAAIWIYDLSGTSQPRRLTFGGRNQYPVWSADGRRIAFQSDRDGALGLYWQAADSGVAERLTTAEPGTAHVPESWSSTGNLSFSVARGASTSLWTFSESEKKASRFGRAESTAPFNSSFSPDGRWLAYTLRPGNSANIFVEPFPATGDQHQITTINGHHPVWLPRQKWLSYRAGGSDQVMVEIKTTPEFSVGNPTPAVVGGLPTVIGVRSFDVTPDETAFITVAPVAENGGLSVTPSQEIRIVVNWFEELKRLVPAK